MKSQFTLLKMMVLALLATTTVTTAKAQRKPTKFIQGKDTLISQNRTWDCDTIYYMRGKVYVTNGATLTIQPGTIIVGDTITKGTLLITKGAKINAVGTPTCPIVFTSPKNPNQKNRGDWGGLILLGKATVNQPGGIGYIEGLPASPLTQYGGGATPDDNDNSGILNYVRIEFAGVALAPNNEINSLTMGGVGRGTTIDFVQVSYANDDSFEWFGGTVNAKHLIAFRGLDDDFDTDNGYSGKVQFGISVRDPLVADISGSNGNESDNDANGSTNLPQTRAVFSNMTFVAGADSATNLNYRNGAQIRRNSHLYIYNSIIMGWPTGLLIDGSATNANVQSDTMIQNNIVAATQSSKWVTSNTGNTTVTNLLLNNASNRFYTGNASVLLSNPYNLSNPNLRPANGSPALTGASFNHIGLNDAFFSKTAFVGALPRQSAQNWATTWVNWKPQSTNYSGLCACSTGSIAAPEEKEEAETAVAAIKVSPNPSHGNFNVELSDFSGKVTIKVTSLTGTVVFAKQVTDGSKLVNVNLNKKMPGIYYVTVSDSKNLVTSKVTVE